MTELNNENLVYKCLKDSSFKEELKKNPKKVLESEYKITVPEGIEIKVLEESLKVKYIVIPFNQSEKKLTDTELQTIVGGSDAEDKVREFFSFFDKIFSSTK